MADTTDRLTVTHDWDRLKPWANELAICEDNEARALRKVAELECALEFHKANIRLAHDELRQAKADKASARHIFDNVLREMTRSDLYEGDGDD